MKAKNVAVEGDTVLGRIQHRHLHPEVARVLQSTTHQHHPCLWFTHVNVVIVVIVVGSIERWPEEVEIWKLTCDLNFLVVFVLG